MNLLFFTATILNPKSDRKCQHLKSGMLVVEIKPSGQGVIKDLLPKKLGLIKYKKFITTENFRDFKDSVILPGFFDMHFHWVQDDVREMGKDSLLEWLNQFTFPAEMKFADLNYATHKAHEFFKKLSAAGTLGGACYSSIHEHAVDAAMKEVKGDFVIGNVMMNMHSPKALTQTPKESLRGVRNLIKRYGRRYVFTPRFAITTAPEVMKEGSALADQAKCFKQTHLSETKAEIDFVLSIYQKIPGFEKVKNYTEIYQKTGMLGPRSLMGHGIHLNTAELKVLSRTKTSLIHCPTSNAPHEEWGLESGLFDFKRVERAKVRWALGSDIGGGPFLSMLDVMRSYVEQNLKVKVRGASFVKALYRATLAGAEILEVGKKTGNLNPKKLANFIVLPMKGAATHASPEALLKQLISKHSRQRHAYDGIPTFVCYEGKTLFDRGVSNA